MPYLVLNRQTIKHIPLQGPLHRARDVSMVPLRRSLSPAADTIVLKMRELTYKSADERALTPLKKAAIGAVMRQASEASQQ